MLTGATGFLGRHCLAALLSRNARVHAVSRGGAGPNHDGVVWHAADLRDPAAAERLVREIRPRRLLHAAWMAVPGRFWSDSDNLLWLESGMALLRAFGECGGEHFVGVGSCAEYDWNTIGYCREDVTPIRPATLYGKTKAAMAAATAAYAAHHGFAWGWGRVFLPYGPGDAPERLIPSVLRGLRRGEPVALSPGTQERDFVYAPDAAGLLVHLLFSSAQGAFNVGTGRPVSIRYAADYLAARVGGHALLRYGLKPADTPPLLAADMTKVATELGWVPKTEVEIGLDHVLSQAGVPPTGENTAAASN